MNKDELALRRDHSSEKSIGTIIDKPNFKAQVIGFPSDIIDTSWMTKAQKTFWELLQNPKNKEKQRKELAKLAGYTSAHPWFTAIRDEKYTNLIRSIGVKIKEQKGNPSHNEVEYIVNPQEREKYLKNDVWDMRMLSQEFPRHRFPSDFIVNFNRIENLYIRKIIKRYLINMLATLKPKTFRNYLDETVPFWNTMNLLFPDIKNFCELDRQLHIEPIIQNLNCSNHNRKKGLQKVRQTFKYMYDYKWIDGPSTDALIINYDFPSSPTYLPRPIPPIIKNKLDDYIEETIIPLLEAVKDTPLVKPQYWDFIIVIRHTGRRFEDMAHLLADGSDADCLRYDLDGDPQLYVDHRIAKIEKDLVIPLAHLNTATKYGNIVERAIKRQRERVKDLPPAPDGYKYLFRENNSKGVVDCITYAKFNHDIVLPKICNGIPLLSFGEVYKITAHQFRHTVATEMIDAGVDIYAIKEFLGHTSVVMTEKYIKVYQQKLKKEFNEKLSKSDATDILGNMPEKEELYDTKWVKNKVIAVFDQGDGCCEHPYKMPSCPHEACKTCVKKKIHPRHLVAVKDTIESYTVHRDNARSFGLSDKTEEFDKIVRFYSIALEKILKGEVFDASKDFYGRK